MIAAYQRSFMKHRVGNVTAIACAIERYRAEHGQLPSAAELAKAEPQMARVFGDPQLTVALVPPHYVVQQVEAGLDNPTKWSVVDGRWVAYAIGTPGEYLRQSEAGIAECGRRRGPRPPNQRLHGPARFVPACQLGYHFASRAGR